MPVIGRGSDGLLNMNISTELIGSSLSSVGGLGFVVRTSQQILEFGGTITSGSVSNTTIDPNGFSFTLYYVKPGSASGVALTTAKVVAGGSAVGSEFTTRDGTVAWASAYANARDRVIPKGSRIFAKIDEAGGDAGDKITCYIKTNEYGAPPN